MTTSNTATTTMMMTATTNSCEIDSATATTSTSTSMDVMNAMRGQECSYETSDYLNQDQEYPQALLLFNTHARPVSNNNNNNTLVLDINAESRSKMVLWCYRVIDFLKFDHETVAIAMNVLDRFMGCASTSATAASAKTSREVYQLAAMTCLYTSIKIHEPQAIGPSMLAQISRGIYTAKQFKDMEVSILMAVSWRVNPPTALSFVQQALTIVSETVNNDHFNHDNVDHDDQVLDQYLLETVYDLARVQIEAAVSEYAFVQVKPSVVAYCSLLNAFLAINNAALEQHLQHTIWLILSRLLLLTPSSLPLSSLDELPHAAQAAAASLQSIQAWLRDVVVQQPMAQDFEISQCFSYQQHEQKQAVATATATAMQQKQQQHDNNMVCQVSPRAVSTGV